MNKNSTKLSAVAILFLGSIGVTEASRQLRVGDVCRFSNVLKCGTCEGGEFQALKNSDKMICAPKFK